MDGWLVAIAAIARERGMELHSLALAGGGDLNFRTLGLAGMGELESRPRKLNLPPRSAKFGHFNSTAVNLKPDFTVGM
jgi:hypothetical protein